MGDGSYQMDLIMRHIVINNNIRWILLHYNISSFGNLTTFLQSAEEWYNWQHWGYNQFDEAFTARFYLYRDWLGSYGYVYEYFEVEIDPENWQAQVIKHMFEYTGIRIASLWYEGGRLVVDLAPAAVMRFDWGSTGGYARTRSLISSMLALPYVSEVQVLVGRQRGVCGQSF